VIWIKSKLRYDRSLPIVAFVRPNLRERLGASFTYASRPHRLGLLRGSFRQRTGARRENRATEEAAISENWHEERTRLTALLKSINDGETTHFDNPAIRELQPANPHNVALLKKRLAALNYRLGTS